MASTEENPVIKLYDETKWTELSDYKLPIDILLLLLEALHKRWTNFLRSLSPADMEKTFIHPDLGEVSVNIGIYAWHGRHHLAHITFLCNRKGW